MPKRSPKKSLCKGMNLGECWILQVAHVAGFAVPKRLDSGIGILASPKTEISGW